MMIFGYGLYLYSWRTKCIFYDEIIWYIFLFDILLFFQKGYSQNQPVIVVDGYFTILDSAEVFSYLKDKDVIKSVSKIESDSAMVLIGSKGRNGIIKINTVNSRSEYSTFFKAEENRMFNGDPQYFIDEELQQSFDPKLFDPQQAKSIEIIFPLKAVQRFGFDFVTGVIIIHTK